MYTKTADLQIGGHQSLFGRCQFPFWILDLSWGGGHPEKGGAPNKGRCFGFLPLAMLGLANRICKSVLLFGCPRSRGLTTFVVVGSFLCISSLSSAKIEEPRKHNQIMWDVGSRDQWFFHCRVRHVTPLPKEYLNEQVQS